MIRSWSNLAGKKQKWHREWLMHKPRSVLMGRYAGRHGLTIPLGEAAK